MSSHLKIPGFDKIYVEYQDQIFRYLFRLTGDWEESRDLSQEVFIKVQTNLANFEGRSSLSTWIYRIATNTANDWFRSSSFQKSKKNLLASRLDKDINEIWTADKEMSIDEQTARQEMNECINRYVYEINENYRIPLILSEYEGLKNQEIAEILNLSLDTVKIRIHRGRIQLKKKMEKGCHITPDPESGLFCDEK